MANPERPALLQKGVNAWNEWQKQNRDVDPDLSGADLREADLSGTDLAEADVSKAKLDKANLSGAKLEGTDL